MCTSHLSFQIENEPIVPLDGCREEKQYSSDSYKMVNSSRAGGCVCDAESKGMTIEA